MRPRPPRHAAALPAMRHSGDAGDASHAASRGRFRQWYNPRVRRRLFNLAAAVSLLLTLIAMAGFVRSQFVRDRWVYAISWDHGYVLISAEGSIRIAWVTPRIFSDPFGFSYRQQPADRMSFGEFERFVEGSQGRVEIVGLCVPWWWVAVAGVPLPVWWGLRRRKERGRTKAGHCLK